MVFLSTSMGCAVPQDVQNGQVMQLSDSNFSWVVGNWDCVGRYRDVPPFTARVETSIYSFSIDGSGRLIGSYRPLPLGDLDLSGSDEVWTPIVGGSGVNMEIDLSYTDGALTVSGSGVSGSDLDVATLGLADFTASSNRGAWHHSVTLTATDAAVVLSIYSFLGEFHNLYLESSCTSGR
jgi:hypothetical protein